MICWHKKITLKKYLMVGLSSESAYLLQTCLELFAGCPLSYCPITHNGLEYSPKRQIYLSEDLSMDAIKKKNTALEKANTVPQPLQFSGIYLIIIYKYINIISSWFIYPDISWYSWYLISFLKVVEAPTILASKKMFYRHQSLHNPRCHLKDHQKDAQVPGHADHRAGCVSLGKSSPKCWTRDSATERSTISLAMPFKTPEDILRGTPSFGNL